MERTMSNLHQPDITVAVMSYNNAAFIGETVESVLSQTGVSFELIVLDDCSSDHSIKVLERYTHDPRFRFEVNPKNLGMMGNYNRCLEVGSGRYVVVLGSDDLIYPGHLESLFSALELHPESPLAYTQCNWIDENGTLLRHADHPGHAPHSYFGGRDEVIGLLSHDNYITPSAIMLRRSIFDAVRLPDGHIHYMDMMAGDWELWTRIARSFPEFVFLRQATVGYRIHGGQVSQSFYGSDKPLAEHTRILELNLADESVRSRAIAAADGIWGIYKARIDAYPPEVASRFRERADALQALLYPRAISQLRADAPFFSVILTTFNRPQLLVDALRSLAAQQFRDFEVILVNDHGDPVESLLEEFDFPITYIYKGRNEGLSAARNTALKVSEGRFVSYLDDDDIYLPDHLAVLAEALERNPESVVYTGVAYVQERIEEGRRIEEAREVRFAHDVFNRDQLFVQNYIPVNTWAHARQMLDKVGTFDESLTAFEDWDMLMRLAARFDFLHLPHVTSEVHVRVSGAKDDHMLGRESKNFLALYETLYARHSGTGSQGLREAREGMLQGLGGATAAQVPNLERWLSERVPTEVENRLISDHLAKHSGGPMFGVLILDRQGDAKKMAATIGSLRLDTNLYATLKLVVLTVGNVPATSADDKLHFISIADRDLAEAINEVVQASSFEWLMLVDSGVLFTPSGLMMLALEIIGAPGCRAVYGDELQRLPDGSLGAAFRPSFSLDLLLSFPVGMAHHWLFRRDLFLELGGFSSEYPEALEFDLITRLIEQEGIAGIGHVDEPLLITDAPVLVDQPAERAIIERHLARRGYQARVIDGLPGRYRIDYGHPHQPSVSVIVPATGRLALLQHCVESVLEHTRYPNYEILIVENGSLASDVAQWLDAVRGLDDAKVRVVSLPTAVNPSHLNNLAAQEARGEYLVLLGTAVSAVSDDWLDQLLNHGMRPEVGVVGPRLLYPDGRICSAGMLLGLRGPASPMFAGESMEAPGYMQRLQVDQNLSAVSGACLLVRKSLYLEVGGMDEQELTDSFNDVDFCLKVRDAGFLNVWTPHSVLMHDHQDAPQPSREAQEQMYAKWLPALARDPAYNQNLSLNSRGFELEADSGLVWRPLVWRPLPVALVHPADPYGCGSYRMIKPLQALKREGMMDGMLSEGLLQVVDLERYDPDIVVLQRQIGDDRLEAMRRIQKFSRAFKVYELDDYLPNLPLKSVHREHMPKDILKSLRRGLGHVDRFVVSTEPLAEAFAGLHPDIRVAENRLPTEWWTGLTSQRRRGRKPRVGWAGGVSHTGDLELIADVVKALADEVEWVFFGMSLKRIRPYVKELHAGVDIDLYPAKLASLDLDLALAPVEQNLFNECKSNLRLLEYGACGFPVVCSDLRCYQGDLPVTRVKNRFKDWVDAIRMHISDLDAAAQAGDQLRDAVHRDWMLEGRNLERWRSAWLPD